MLNIQESLAELKANKLTAVPMDTVEEFVTICHQQGICPQKKTKTIICILYYLSMLVFN